MIAVLLAAGEGRRMGGPKALLELDGLSALERCTASLRDAGMRELRVVLGAEAGRVRARHADLAACFSDSVRFVDSPNWRAGQTASLRAGLLAAPVTGAGFLLHTVDHPLVGAADVRALLRAFDARAPHELILAPSVGGRRGHPSLFAAELVPEFLALGDDEPAHRVLRADPARVAHELLEDPWIVRDLDTPDDLDAARAALRERAANS